MSPTCPAAHAHASHHHPPPGSLATSRIHPFSPAHITKDLNLGVWLPSIWGSAGGPTPRRHSPLARDQQEASGLLSPQHPPPGESSASWAGCLSSVGPRRRGAGREQVPVGGGLGGLCSSMGRGAFWYQDVVWPSQVSSSLFEGGLDDETAQRHWCEAWALS